MLTFAICDDEPLMAQEIKRHLSTYMKEKEKGTAGQNGERRGAAVH